ncbi:MAG: 4-phosphoerythronate dehydrogenase [Gammaproteobacteria bacterium]|nr:4-phosphoerythronate dehydrogenase [Gammaproteobacteria bacterium]
MKIVCDENIPLAGRFFEAFGELVYYSGRAISSDNVRDADILLVRSITLVNEALLAGSAVKFVGTATIGEDHVDKDYLNAQGIGFASAPGCNACSVAEYVLSVIVEHVLDMSEEPDMALLRQRRVAIMGAGNVGMRVKQLCDGLGIPAFCYDPFKPALTSMAVEDIAQADIVTFHTPLTKGGAYPTFHKGDHSFFESLKPGALLINTSRGAVFDNAVLLEVLQHRRDLRVVLDVWEGEPYINTDLLQRCYLASAHIAGYSYDGKVRGTEMLFNAMNRHFNLQVKAPTGLQKNQLLIRPPAELKGLALLSYCIRAAYAVRHDDQILRSKVAEAGSRLMLGENFDYLRKNYSVRREFNNYHVMQAQVCLDDKRCLESLGFDLA